MAQLVKNLPTRLGRSPGEAKGYPLQYSGLENSMDCIVHVVAKSWSWLGDFHFHCPSGCFVYIAPVTESGMDLGLAIPGEANQHLASKKPQGWSRDNQEIKFKPMKWAEKLAGRASIFSLEGFWNLLLLSFPGDHSVKIEGWEWLQPSHKQTRDN